MFRGGAGAATRLVILLELNLHVLRTIGMADHLASANNEQPPLARAVATARPIGALLSFPFAIAIGSTLSGTAV